MFLLNVFCKFVLIPKKIFNCIFMLRIKEYCEIGNDSIVYFKDLENQIVNLQKDKSKLKIGNNTHVKGSLLVYPYGNGLQIGDNSYIGDNSIVRAASQIIIGNFVLIAHNVTIIDTDSHEIDYKERSASFVKMIKNGVEKCCGNVKTSPIIIEDNVWISYNVCILKGVTIGEGAIIGAGSVVTKDVPAWTLVVGNPAIVIKKIKR